MVIIGILATTYSYLLPMIYRQGDLERERGIYLVLGICLIGGGVFVCAFGGCAHAWVRSREVGRNCVDQSPIVVDYELPPYDVRLQSGNFDFVADMERFYS